MKKHYLTGNLKSVFALHQKKNLMQSFILHGLELGSVIFWNFTKLPLRKIRMLS